MRTDAGDVEDYSPVLDLEMLCNSWREKCLFVGFYIYLIVTCFWEFKVKNKKKYIYI